MMAFYSVMDEKDRKTFRPTPEFEELLKHEVVTEKDLRVFRMSNKVKHLMHHVLGKRGFIWLGHRREWRRAVASNSSNTGHGPTDSQIAQWAGAMGLKPPSKVAKLDTGLHPYHKKLLEAMGVPSETVAATPPESTVSVMELIDSARHKYIKEFGIVPNVLFLNAHDLGRLNKYGLTHGGFHVAFGDNFEGMVLRSAPASFKPVCSNLTSDGSDGQLIAEAANELGEVVAKVFKIKAETLKTETLKELTPKPKTVVPPSRMGRKLAI